MVRLIESLKLGSEIVRPANASERLTKKVTGEFDFAGARDRVSHIGECAEL
jgi:hypothetical protein